MNLSVRALAAAMVDSVSRPSPDGVLHPLLCRCGVPLRVPGLLPRLAVLLVTAVSSGTSGWAQTLPIPPARTVDSVEEVRKAIGPARCTTDADCRTSAIGSLACGGPAGWVAWSMLDADQAALREAIRRHDAIQAQPQHRSGEASICRVVEDPGAACFAEPSWEHGRCRLRAPGQGGVIR